MVRLKDMIQGRASERRGLIINTPSGHKAGKQICKPLGVIILIEAFPLALVSLFQNIYG